MRKNLIYFIALFFSSCAIQVPPGGGEKDITPPKLISTSPENHSTNVQANDIRLNFDEYPTIKDANTQLVVSPLLNSAPVTKVRKRSILIHISDTLLANTTYTLNFGNSIADLNEGNVFEDYQFVFSTGDVIDSLNVQGRIETAFDLKKDKGMLVMLYRSDDDSLPFKVRPLYFGKTDANGEFKISNIAPGKYKAIALEDKDGNYLYQKGEEQIAFSDSLINAGDKDLHFRLFKEGQTGRLSKAVSVAPGQVQLIFPSAGDSVKLNWITDLKMLDVYAQSFSDNKDTLTIWYKNLESDSLSFYYNSGNKFDTVDVRLFKKMKDSGPRGKMSLTLSAVDPGAIHNYALPYKINLNHPVVKFDKSKFLLKQDSIVISPAEIVFTDSLKMHLSMNVNWKELSHYELTVYPGAMEDIYGLSNDTVNLKWSVKSETDYGTMAVKITGQVGNTIVQLLDDKAQVVRESKIESDTVVNYNYLDPTVYRLKLIRDENKNGKWDSGELIQKIQPEVVEYYPENITVRANWDVDVKWIVK